MTPAVSPKYIMALVKQLDKAIWEEFKTYKDVKYYIKRWHYEDGYNEPNFVIVLRDTGEIDLQPTLHNIDDETVLKMAIDLGLETPDFVPSIPTFRNELKASFTSASSTLEKAIKNIEDHPDLAIGLANSSLESIIKEIMKDARVSSQVEDGLILTLYALTQEVLKVFQLYPKADFPKEIRNIGSSLLKINQNIEQLRSEKTDMHGKTSEDYIIKEPLYAYFVVNSVATVGLFLKSYYEKKFPKEVIETNYLDDLPF